MRTVFCINTVTGPDEYTALVNNNIYTNLMARANLVWAVDLLTWMKRHDSDAWADLSKRLKIDGRETAGWTRAAKLMFVPFDRQRGLYPQDDAFFHKRAWDATTIPEAERPLFLHHHPLVIYRYQILKQPDLVLAQLLQGDLFTGEEKRANFAYYEPLTTGDSSLSPCILSIMAVETGQAEKGWKYFQETVRVDLDNLHGNVCDGIHAAAMAGGWLALVYGFGGFREHIETADDADPFPQRITYSFRPVLPKAINRLSFRLRLDASWVEVDVDSGCRADGVVTTYRLIEGAPIRFHHCGLAVALDDARRERKFETAPGAARP